MLLFGPKQRYHGARHVGIGVSTILGWLAVIGFFSVWGYNVLVAQSGQAWQEMTESRILRQRIESNYIDCLHTAVTQEQLAVCKDQYFEDIKAL